MSRIINKVSTILDKHPYPVTNPLLMPFIFIEEIKVEQPLMQPLNNTPKPSHPPATSTVPSLNTTVVKLDSLAE